MKQTTLTAMVGASGARGVKRKRGADRQGVRRILLALVTKGDYAVANLIQYFSPGVPGGPGARNVRTRGYFVPPRDGATYMRYASYEGLNPAMYELQQFYEMGNFQRISDCLLSQREFPTSFDKKVALGLTMEGANAVIVLGTDKSVEHAVFQQVSSLAGELKCPLLALAYNASQLKKKSRYTPLHAQLKAFLAPIVRQPDFRGDVMIINLLSGSRAAHLKHIIHTVTHLLRWAAVSTLEDGDVADAIACRFTLSNPQHAKRS